MGLKMVMYVVQHTHHLGDDEEDVKFIGVYSSEKNACEAIKRLTKQPGFCDSPDTFDIDEYPVDEDNWQEGYKTEIL